MGHRVSVGMGAVGTATADIDVDEYEQRKAALRDAR
jgi:hypothetical protein